MGKIISVANQKGGVGKTTTSVNMSTWLAKKGKKVLLVDADPQGNATSGLGVEKDVEESVYDLIINEAKAREIVKKTQIKNLDISVYSKYKKDRLLRSFMVLLLSLLTHHLVLLVLLYYPLKSLIIFLFVFLQVNHY